jgi:hypothetical protein
LVARQWLKVFGMTIAALGVLAAFLNIYLKNIYLKCR